jgi:glucosamine-6-phosphate deaminase
MNLQICDAVSEVAAVTSGLIVKQLRRTPATVLGLPTGQTALPVYDALVRLHRAGRADFSQVHTVNLDEFIGLGPADPRSFRGFMEQHLFRHINIPAEHVHFLAGDARDTERECALYERLIASLGGIDLQLLGVGRNGHIGFNEPSRDLQLRTHRVRLRMDTRRANADAFGGKVARVPREALSMGMATILQARSIVLVALGRPKAAADRAAAANLPATLVESHRQPHVSRPPHRRR